jgi:hypothetical protein
VFLRPERIKHLLLVLQLLLLQLSLPQALLNLPVQ